MAAENKSSALLPVVRRILVCEHVEAAANNPRRANIYGLLASAVVKEDVGAFPSGFGFSVYVMLSDCRASGSGRIVVTEAVSGDVCYSGVPNRIALSSDPLEVYGLIFRVAECIIPRAGLCWIEFEFDGMVVGQEPILVKAR
jgi:hypothetical protein